MTAQSTERLVLLVLVVIGTAISGVGPYDRITWWLEVAPILVAIPILIATGENYRLTRLLYRLMAIHALLIMVGGHYTYAHVPLGFWVQDMFDLARNHYDRLGHFLQGFVPAMIAREVLLRSSPLQAGKWLFFLVSCVALAISAFYEFTEWWAALVMGGQADDFLATQGDIWDTQWDMFLALTGAVIAQLSLARVQDRQLEQLKSV
jgi:putative membrane protein